MNIIRHGKDWIDIILVDIVTISIISILLFLSSLIPYTYPSSNFNEVVKSEDKDYNIHILTQEELSQLYTLKFNDKYIDTQIQEFSYEDCQLLLKVGRTEGGPTLLGQLWTIRTIINRVYSPEFPDNVWDVISQDKQFKVVETGIYEDAEINSDSHMALAMIESGWDETQGALYFESSSNTSNSWHVTHKQFIKEVEGQRYYK